MDILTAGGMVALFEVIGMDLILAGDNAVVIGLAAAGLPPDQRRRAILVGILAATVMRIGLALLATSLLAYPGVTFMGGFLLCWVCWKMWHELRQAPAPAGAAGAAPAPAKAKSIGQATLQIILADLSMSLDNVLSVAGAARGHPSVLVIGLIFSIGLMGIAASYIAGLLNRHQWIAYLGLAIICFVAVNMLWTGAAELGALIG